MADNKRGLFSSLSRLLGGDKIESALKNQIRLVQENPKDPGARNTLGDLYQRKGEVAKAIEEFKTAAQLYQADGFYPQATAMCRKILRIDDDRPDIYLQLAELYAAQGLKRESAEHYRLVAERLAEKGQLREALEAYRQVVNLDPQNIKIRLLLAELYERESFRSEAVKEYLQIAEFLSRRGELEEAERVLKRAVILGSNMAAPAKAYATLLIGKERYEDAAKVLEAVQADEQDAQILYLKGVAYANTGRLEEARQAFETVISREEGHVGVRTDLGDVLYDLGHIEEAFRQYLLAVDGYAARGEMDLVRERLEEMIEIEGFPVEALERLARIYQNSGEEDELIRVYKRMALWYRKADELAKAENILHQVLSLRPGDKAANKALAKIRTLLEEQQPKVRTISDVVEAPTVTPSAPLPEDLPAGAPEILPEDLGPPPAWPEAPPAPAQPAPAAPLTPEPAPPEPHVAQSSPTFDLDSFKIDDYAPSTPGAAWGETAFGESGGPVDLESIRVDLGESFDDEESLPALVDDLPEIQHAPSPSGDVSSSDFSIDFGFESSDDLVAPSAPETPPPPTPPAAAPPRPAPAPPPRARAATPSLEDLFADIDQPAKRAEPPATRRRGTRAPTGLTGELEDLEALAGQRGPASRRKGRRRVTGRLLKERRRRRSRGTVDERAIQKTDPGVPTAPAPEEGPEALDELFASVDRGPGDSGMGGDDLGAFFDLAGELADDLDLSSTGLDLSTRIIEDDEPLPELERSVEHLKNTHEELVGTALANVGDDLKQQYELATAFKSMGLLEDAVASFRKAAADPSLAPLCASELGVCLLELGEIEEAIEELKRGLELGQLRKDQATGLQALLAVAYFGADRNDEACRLLKRPGVMDALRTVGRTHENLEEACKQLRALAR